MNDNTIQTDQFLAKDNSGQNYTILEFTELVDSTSFGDTGSTLMDSAREYRLSTGEQLNRIGEHEFVLVETGETLTKF